MLLNQSTNPNARQDFLERNEELSFIESRLTGSWQWVHLYGLSGIGKSTILQMLAERLNEQRRQVIYVDGNNGFLQPSALLYKLQHLLQDAGGTEMSGEPSLEAVSGWLNRAARSGGAVLLFDTFEKWEWIEDWLREQFVPALSPDLRIVSAGRNLPGKNWFRHGWAQWMECLEVQPLTNAQQTVYLHRRGIRDPELIRHLQSFCGGVPLALSLASMAVLNRRAEEISEALHRSQTLDVLLSILMEDLGDTNLHRCLDVAGTVWRFNQDALEAILGEKIPNDQFRELCRLPFIVPCDGGWRVHDSVRAWLDQDIRRRLPEKSQSYRQRAIRYLRGQTKESDPQNLDRLSLLIDKFYLIEHPLVRALLFEGHTRAIDRRSARETDLPEMERLINEYFAAMTPGFPDGIDQAGHLPEIWAESPDAFDVYWVGDRLIGFSSLLPLTDAVVGILRKIPVYRTLLGTIRPNPHAYLLWCSGTYPAFMQDYQSLMLRNSLTDFNKAEHVYAVIAIAAFFPIMEPIGFERISWADYPAPNGTTVYRGFHLDLSKSDWHVRLDAILENLSLQQALPSLAETAELVKRTLVHYDRPDIQSAAVLQLRGALAVLRSPDADADGPVVAYRRLVENKLAEMGAQSEDGQLMEHILRLAYVRRIGTHEVVAERVQLPLSTYYRYLKKAVSHLTVALMNANG